MLSSSATHLATMRIALENFKVLVSNFVIFFETEPCGSRY